MASFRCVPSPPIPQHPESVPEFICSLCHELATEPKLTPCDHLFCHRCIVESLRHRRECPIDRQSLTRGDLSEVGGVLRRVYEGIAVRCPNDRCDWTGAVGNYSAHSRRCRVASVDLSVIEGLQREIEIKERTIREKDAIIEEKEEALEKSTELLAILVEKLQHEYVEVDDDYKYDRTRVKELSQLICKYLENKPDNVDRNRIYNCVKLCHDDLLKEWGDNPERYHEDVRMLLSVCLASNWFTEKQCSNMSSWVNSWTFH